MQKNQVNKTQIKFWKKITLITQIGQFFETNYISDLQ